MVIKPLQNVYGLLLTAHELLAQLFLERALGHKPNLASAMFQLFDSAVNVEVAPALELEALLLFLVAACLTDTVYVTIAAALSLLLSVHDVRLDLPSQLKVFVGQILKLLVTIAHLGLDVFTPVK